jgi:SAM-dependent methyltransferase
MPHDPDYTRDFYDAYGEREWGRFDQDASGLVNLHIHRWYLERLITAGQRVLEAGAGPGRFTIELARLGARIVVGDISPVQLAENERRVAEAGWAAAVEQRVELDIVDLSRFEDASFDVVVCYGGALSYVFDRAGQALDEMHRVLRPGGTLLVSVMSLVGATRRLLRSVLEVTREHGTAIADEVIRTGDLVEQAFGAHRCHMYRWSELEALVLGHGYELVAASASNFLSVGNEASLSDLPRDTARWEALLRWEMDLCREPGARDGGTHIIAAARRPH